VLGDYLQLMNLILVKIWLMIIYDDAYL